jgi:hypothetical protein
MELFNGWERFGSVINGEVINLEGAHDNTIYTCTMKYSESPY